MNKPKGMVDVADTLEDEADAIGAPLEFDAAGNRILRVPDSGTNADVDGPYVPKRARSR